MKWHTKSKELYKRACRSLAGGVSSEFRKYNYPQPLFYERGVGSRIIDVDGNSFLDFTLSQGPLILGHSPPEILAAVQEACMAGQIFAGQYLLELELAEKLQQLIPCAELIRFSLSGSEAVHTAVRLARAMTGRTKFLRFEGHYHGWLDNVAISVNGTELKEFGNRAEPKKVPWTGGLPDHVLEETLVLPWNDLALVEALFEQEGEEIAAIITEPVMCNAGCIAPQPGYLEGLRRVCDQYGVILIFDEVITGFRLGMAGAQGFFGVMPDLAVFGKAIANGWPLTALVGKKSVMQLIADGQVIHAGTLNSGQPGVAAALATLEILARDAVHAKLFALGQRLMNGLREAARQTHQPLLVQGLGPMFHTGFTTLRETKDMRETFSYDQAKYRLFLAGMHERGVRLIPRGLWYISAAHTEAEIDEVIAAAREILAAL